MIEPLVSIRVGTGAQNNFTHVKHLGIARLPDFCAT